MPVLSINQAISLQDTVRTFKDEIGGKEDLVSNLEAEAKEQELQIVQLRSQLQTIQDEAKGNAREKTDLAKNLEGMRREVEEQQHRVTELISINEDLIAFSESKEDEVNPVPKFKGLRACFSLNFLINPFNTRITIRLILRTEK